MTSEDLPIYVAINDLTAQAYDAAGSTFVIVDQDPGPAYDTGWAWIEGDSYKSLTMVSASDEPGNGYGDSGDFEFSLPIIGTPGNKSKVFMFYPNTEWQQGYQLLIEQLSESSVETQNGARPDYTVTVAYYRLPWSWS